MTGPATSDRIAKAGRDATASLTDAADAHLSQVKDDVADRVSSVASAATAARSELPAGSLADPLLEQAVDAFGKVSSHLQDADISDLAREAGDFARRNPVLVLGGAALLGFAAARFLKADPVRNTDAPDPWADHLERS